MNHQSVKPKFVVDDRGRRKSVLLTVAEYRRLMKRIEDLEDALALDEARKTATGFTEYSKIREDLKKAGRL